MHRTKIRRIYREMLAVVILDGRITLLLIFFFSCLISQISTMTTFYFLFLKIFAYLLFKFLAASGLSCSTRDLQCGMGIFRCGAWASL